MSRYHPEQHILIDYAAGNLSPIQATCITAHLEFCPQCRQQMQHLNHLGGQMIDQLPPSAVEAPLFDSIMAKIEQSPDSVETPPIAPPPTQRPGWWPKVLNHYATVSGSEPNWRRLTLAVKHVTLLQEKGEKLQLYRIKPGGKVANHDHGDSEWTMVLKGSFSDHNGVYQQGDFVACDAGDIHHPVATIDGECICLAAEKAPIEFTSWWGKLVNPLLKLAS